uniref:4.6 kDa salivary protein n=1 Tax=Lutzomyia longipalpis TaxID=7200 RepID=Q5WPT6_LUTLO|nr:4.6 kDa salivary protein [Lutzomyia longipalpis]
MLKIVLFLSVLAVLVICVAAMPGSNVPWHISREELEKLREARKNHKALEKAIDELIDKYL